MRMTSPSFVMPALLTSTSHAPKASTVSLNSCAISAGSPTFALSATASAPFPIALISATTPSAASTLPA